MSRAAASLELESVLQLLRTSKPYHSTARTRMHASDLRELNTETHHSSHVNFATYE